MADRPMAGDPPPYRLPEGVPAFVVNAGAFIWHQGRYLMMVRGAGEEIAPGALTQPGGKMDADGPMQDAVEETLRREILEEVGVEVAESVYVESHTFDGTFNGQTFPVLDLVFLCRYVSGEPRAEDPDEVAGIEWLTPDEMASDPRVMPWTRASLARVEAVRLARGWA